MIYILLFWEFFKIGLFAVGGGLVTIPFLFDLAQQYPWFTTQELTDMIAVSQSTPGPMGINMATYAGYKAAGICGGIIATLSEVLPAMIVIYFIAKILAKWAENKYITCILADMRPAVMALILFAGLDIAKISLTSEISIGLLAFLILTMRIFRCSPIWYIIFSGIIGTLLKL